MPGGALGHPSETSVARYPCRSAVGRNVVQHLGLGVGLSRCGPVSPGATGRYSSEQRPPDWEHARYLA